MAIFKAPKRTPKKAKPRTLTAQHVREAFSRVCPCYTVGYETRRSVFIREEKMRSGALSMIYGHPFTGVHHRWVIDYQTGMIRDLGPIRQKVLPRLSAPAPRALPAPMPPGRGLLAMFFGG